MESKACLLSEKPEKKDGVLPLSVSKIKTFKDCPAKYRFSYIEKLPSKETDYLIFGKFVHEVLENFHKTYLDPQLPLFQQKHHVVMGSCFNFSYENWKSKLTKEQKEKAFEICGLYLKQLSENIKNKIQPEILAVEEEFFISIDDKILLTGLIDRVQMDPDGVLHVADYKTSNSITSLKKDFLQLLTYAFVKCLQNPELKKVRTSYILLKHDLKSIVKEFDVEEIMKVENSILEYADKINKEKLYRPVITPLCNWCSFQVEHCEEGRKVIPNPKSPNYEALIAWQRNNAQSQDIVKFGISDW